MLANYLVLLGTTNVRKSKRSVKAVNSPLVNQEKTFHVLFWWKASASFSKGTIYDETSGATLFLICSYFSIKFQARVLVKLLL